MKVTNYQIRISSVWNEQLVNKSFIVKPPWSCEKLLETGEMSFEDHFMIIKQKTLAHKFYNFFWKLGKFLANCRRFLLK